MGKGGGGGGHTPVEAKETGRSKQFVKIVEVISEGEIEGLADGMKSVYLDNTPIQNADGSYNFQNVLLEGRVGSQVQDIIPGFNTSEKEISVSTQVRKTTPITRTVTDNKVSRLRLTLGVQSLFSQADNGDTNGTSVSLVVYIGNASYPITISGKYSSQYLQQHTFTDLPSTPFTVRVERLTDDSKSQRLQNNTVWASYTEIIDTEFTYPNTALIGVKFDSEYFSNIPNRTYDIKGLKIKVPSNYNPETRQYTGLWDGTFKIEWSDNPAWVLYDVVTNKRYGLGQRLGEFGADKWALYQVAQYCDQLVPNGFGGKEPRFTCNAWLTDQRSAYDVINDICSIFRAMPVWNGRELTVVMDRPADPVWTYTNANVQNGEFTYTYSAKKARHNAIQVEYADKDNAYEKAIEYVSDDESIRTNGLNVKKITAFGCTSRGQAHRTGLWLLQTEKLETKTVTFTVGAEGLMHVPGDIIRVADVDYAGTNIGGRALKIDGKKVTLDREVEITANSYLTYINEKAKHQDVKIVSVKGTEVTLDREPVGLVEYGVWSLTTQKINTQLFRALSVKEENKGKYTIVALQHEPQKEAIVDNGAHFEPVQYSQALGYHRIQNAEVKFTESGIELHFDYATTGDANVRYQIKLYRTYKGTRTLYQIYDDLKEAGITFTNLPDGEYVAEIRAKNSVGQLSDPVTRTFEINLDIKRFVTKSLLFAIELDWDLPKTATIGNYTEIWRSTTNDINSAIKIATLPYPQNNYVMSGVSLNAEYYFWLRCGDKNDNKGEFTDAAFGEADHNPDSLLNMVEETVAKVGVGKELIESLKGDISDAVSAESRARQETVNHALAQIEGQAQETGTAIKRLEQADKNQAETIKTVTAKADSALSGINTVKQAQANSDKANAQQISALTSKVNSAESKVTQISSTVTGIDGKVSAMHTIKTQTVAGGRTAIAGIALGANQQESSVIVMADKFGIVANANDNNVKQVFSVANGQVGIRGDLVVAGSVTRDKLSSEGGGNLFYNPIFANNGNGWSLYVDTNNMPNSGWSFNRNTGDYQGYGYLNAENQFRWQANRANTNGGNVRFGGLLQDVKLVKGRYYCFSSYVGAHRGFIDLNVEQGAIQVIKKSWSGRGKNGGYGSGAGIISGVEEERRIYLIFKANGNANQNYRMIINMWADGTQNNPLLAIRRPMLEECTEHTREPSPWVNAGVTEVHGGSIIANTIRGDHIQANQEIRAPRISGGEIDISGGDGVLKVGRTGSFLVRASSQNRGLVMNNNQIIVYDSNGKVRVKIGLLN